MQKRGRISVRGIVQGVGFRPFVYARACEFGIAGSVKNLGSEVEIYARGERFTDFLAAVSRGPPMSRIDSVDVTETTADIPDGFVIKKSGTGSFSGMIPPDISICDDCIADIFTRGGRYEGYWATSCVNCGPRYSIIQEIPYDRERTSMDSFPMCTACAGEYGDPHSRRHHAQTIACHTCGPGSGSWIGPGPISHVTTLSERQPPFSMPGRSSQSGASGDSTLPASKNLQGNSSPGLAGSSSRSR